MTSKERELALYCLKASSDYHSEVCEECINYPNCDHTIQDDVTETIIKALEQEPKWIPVSARLPEERGLYLAVFKEEDTGYQLIPRVANYIGKNNWRIIDEEAFAKEYLDILECVAWMPLPEPYKVEQLLGKT